MLQSLAITGISTDISVSSLYELRELDPPRATDIAILSSISPIIAQEAKETTMAAISEVLNFKDEECDPDAMKIFSAQMHMMNIDKMVAKQIFETQAHYVNCAVSWIKEVTEKATFYYMKPLLGKFFSAQRVFCRVLHEFHSHILSSSDINAIKRHLNTLRDAHDNLKIKYEKAKEKIAIREQRDKEEPTQEQKSSHKTVWGSIWNFGKWILKYQTCLYIVGILAYNSYMYITLPYGKVADLIIQTFGVLCYTFASNTDLILQAIHMIEYSISNVLYFLFNILGSGILDKLPKTLVSAFGFCKALIFYVFLYYIIGWLRYFIRLVCQGIVVFGASYSGGAQLTAGIWGIIADYQKEIAGSTTKALAHVSSYIKNKGLDAISDLFSIVFTDILTVNVINPVWTGAKNIVDSAFDLPSKILGTFTSKPEQAATLAKKMIGGIKETASMVVEDISDDIGDIPSKASHIIEETISSSTIDGLVELSTKNKHTYNVIKTMTENPQVGMIISKQTEELRDIISSGINSVVNTIQEQGQAVYEKGAETVMGTLEGIMEQNGTSKVWQAIKNLETPGMITDKNQVIMYALGQEVTTMRRIAVFFIIWAILAAIFGPWTPINLAL